MRILALASIALAAVSCAASSLGPAEIRLGEDACAHCRMTLLSSRTAAQIVAPAEEPIMFDELGCLRDYLSQHSMADGARVFVADHRTGAWVDAATAIFTKTPLSTPIRSSAWPASCTGSSAAAPCPNGRSAPRSRPRSAVRADHSSETRTAGAGRRSRRPAPAGGELDQTRAGTRRCSPPWR